MLDSVDAMTSSLSDCDWAVSIVEDNLLLVWGKGYLMSAVVIYIVMSALKVTKENVFTSMQTN